MSESQKHEWIHAPPPADKPGWYAQLVCYDVEEGAFPCGAYWDGEKWVGGPDFIGYTSHLPLVLPSKEEAQKLADQYDPKF